VSVVYVDSGSSDNSLEIARAQNAEIVELDMAMPFTAARARNEGFARLHELHSDLTHVQFVDGDCIVLDDWVERAKTFLEEHQSFAVVCGRRRERFPENSVYNRLCNIEWNTPVGEALACGGDALMRVDAFKAAGGFNPAVIAGEEPELCVRLRREGWKIWRLDAEMTLHDAAIATFGQWWVRTKRGGYAYALGASMHGGATEHHWVRERRRSLLWGAFLPLAILVGLFVSPFALVFLLSYPLQVARIAINNKELEGFSLLYGLFMVAAKFAETAGIVRFSLDRLVGRRSAIIEYKALAGEFRRTRIGR
jgi:GT2 family glycosyltransferase